MGLLLPQRGVNLKLALEGYHTAGIMKRQTVPLTRDLAIADKVRLGVVKKKGSSYSGFSVKLDNNYLSGNISCSSLHFNDEILKLHQVANQPIYNCSICCNPCVTSVLLFIFSDQ